MPSETIYLVLSDPKLSRVLERDTLTPAGYDVTMIGESHTADSLLHDHLPDLLILSEQLKSEAPLSLAKKYVKLYPQLPLIVISSQDTEGLALEALRAGVNDLLNWPVRAKNLLEAIERVLARRKRMQETSLRQSRHNTQALQDRVSALESLQRIGRKVTALLDLDSVLTAVVDSAVNLTGAEEGSLLLLDESTGELYVRASRNFQDEFVRTFRLPIRDTLAGQVLSTGKPLLVNEQTPQKIKTAYLVYTLVYVPLVIHNRVIGVLGVDNRQGQKTFNEYHITTLSALADYAAIAIENARLYNHSEVERTKLETILTGVEEGVIVVDQERRIILVNPMARQAFGLNEQNLTGKRFDEVIQHQDLLEILEGEKGDEPFRAEVALEDGRVFNAQVTPISEVGLAVTMQDITHLKELDRIKSDFVSTVSHDLRSPLTAILGYVELIDRVGPINDMQRDFIRRVQVSVQNITALINDLLDLGRIEAGFDSRMEILQLASIVNYVVEGFRNKVKEKNLVLEMQVSDQLPLMLGNPVRLRQMVSNIVGNAIKYTPEGGAIRISAQAEGEQIIVKVEDSGPGIPPADQPYIFDKFYRASNAPLDVPGTGLGLAIVKSIIDNHQGRIWVDSVYGQGTRFTIVLPIADQEL